VQVLEPGELAVAEQPADHGVQLPHVLVAQAEHPGGAVGDSFDHLGRRQVGQRQLAVELGVEQHGDDRLRGAGELVLSVELHRAILAPAEPSGRDPISPRAVGGPSLPSGPWSRKRTV
jgi:hypothetical protein